MKLTCGGNSSLANDRSNGNGSSNSNSSCADGGYNLIDFLCFDKHIKDIQGEV